MVDIRCRNFNEVLWAYVVENASKRGKTRCETLEEIVEEHMRFMVKEQQERLSDL